MIIRKLFKFEGAHIVRNCYSEKCKYNLHGHSFKVEVFLEGKKLDRAGMLCDFSILKGQVKDFIESFDHCYFFWNKESEGFKSFIKGNFERWISLPFSPSAENLSILFYWAITRILFQTKFCNGEGPILVRAVRVHETDTGYAEARRDDLLLLDSFSSNYFEFSDELRNNWKELNLLTKIFNGEQFSLNEPFQQIIE